MKNKKLLVFIALSAFVVPLATLANIKINEVAWMGNEKSQYGEWIELYNDGSSIVDLKDAALYEAGGKTLIIKLTKTIDPSGYYLVARSTPSMPDPVQGLADDLGSFGGSGLSNAGESLVLKSATGDVLDTLDASAGWPAGDASTKQTMQWSSNAWITATGTPRAQNFISVISSVNNSSNSTTTTQNSGDSSITNLGSTNNPLDGESGSLSAHSSQAVLSNVKEDEKVVASAGRDRLVLVDTPLAFEARLYTTVGDMVEGGDISWSFGDGETATGKNIIHKYKFPGDYVVILNMSRAGEDFVARTSVRVVASNLQITEATPTYVKIKNGSVYEANVGGWQLVSGRFNFTFPKDTIILPNKEITIAKELFGFVLEKDIQLMSPAKNIASTFTLKSETLVTADVLKTEVMASTTIVNQQQAPQPQQDIAAILRGAEQKLLDAKRYLDTKNQAVVVAAKQDVIVSIKDQPVVAANNTVEVVEKPMSILQTVLGIPAAGFRFIKSLLF